MANRRKKTKKRAKKITAAEQKYFDLSVILFQNLLGLFDFRGEDAPGLYEKFQQTYANEVWVYACVYRIANSGAGIPIRLYKKGKGEERQEIYNHPLLDILSKPNRQMGQYDLTEWTLASMELTGMSYWLLDERGVFTGRPGSIYVLNPKYMRPLKDKQKYIRAYRYQIGTEYKDFNPDQIIVFKDYNPMNPFHGLGSVAPVKTTVDSNIAANTYNRNFFRNSARPDGVLETDKALGKNQWNRVLRQWRQKYGTEKHAHMTAILEKGLKYKAISTSQKDMDFVQLKKMNREDIMAAFGVPPAMVGVFEYANYANSKEQRAIFWEDTEIPKLNKYFDRLNRDLTIRYGENLELGYDPKDIKALQRDMKQMSETAKNLFSIGLPLNAIIDAMELPFEHVEGGDVGYLPLNLSPMTGEKEEPNPDPEPNKPKPPKPAPEKPAENQAKPKPKPKKRVKVTINQKSNSKRTPYDTEEKKKKKWLAFVKQQGKWENKYEKKLRTYFTSQERDIIANLNKFKSVSIRHISQDIFQVYGIKVGNEQKRRISIDDVILNRGKEIQELTKISGPIHRAALLDQARQEYRDMGLPIGNFDVDNPRVRKWLKKYGLKNAKEVQDYSTDVVRQALIDGIKEGESIDNLVLRIQDKYKWFKDSRARRIARTETIGASNEGALESYRQAEIVEKKGWLATYDGKARIGHEDAGRKYNEKGAIPIDDDFVITGEAGGELRGPAPGQMGAAADDINCRCSVFPVLKET
jgi:HK97 family phage portal protein